jgi:hypothetical protein
MVIDDLDIIRARLRGILAIVDILGSRTGN